jgi:nucleotide-binding universal stress UspA family protein
VADKVIRGAVCDTLVAGPQASEAAHWLEGRLVPAFKSILVPLDGSALAEQALPVTKSFAEAFGSTLHLVRVVPIPQVVDSFPTESYTPETLETMVQVARDYLTGVAGGLALDGDVTTDVLIGEASSQLTQYATENRIDLVIMTSHGRGGVVRTALGSVTDRLVGGAAPVLVVRASTQ